MNRTDFTVVARIEVVMMHCISFHIYTARSDRWSISAGLDDLLRWNGIAGRARSSCQRHMRERHEMIYAMQR